MFQNAFDQGINGLCNFHSMSKGDRKNSASNWKTNPNEVSIYSPVNCNETIYNNLDGVKQARQVLYNHFTFSVLNK